MNLNDLFFKLENTTRYYEQQISLAESLISQKSTSSNSSNTRNKNDNLLEDKIYLASINFYNKMKRKQNKEILNDIFSILGISSTVNIDDLTDTEVNHLIEDLRTKYDSKVLN